MSDLLLLNEGMRKYRSQSYGTRGLIIQNYTFNKQ